MIFDERIVTKATPKTAFQFLGDFKNLPDWDPSITRVEQLVAGPVGLGTRFRVALEFLGTSSALDYHVETWEPQRRAVLIGTGPLVTATDTIIVSPWHGGSRVRWKAEINFVFPLQIVDPVFGWMFGPSVRSAVDTLKKKLDALAG